MQTPTAVEGTDRTMAWETENVRPRVRRIAEDAARRAGVRLEQWLDEALLEWAAGARPEEGHGESRSDHSGPRRDPVSLRDNGSFPDLRPILQTEEARARQNENSLEVGNCADRAAGGARRGSYCARVRDDRAHARPTTGKSSNSVHRNRTLDRRGRSIGRREATLRSPRG